MLPTPSTSHVNYDHVYEPAEDSFLLLDTISARSEIDFLQNHFSSYTPPPFIVEVGTGSGVVLAFVTANAHTLFGRSDVASAGVDINAFACRATADTVRIALADANSAAPKPSAFFLSSVTGDLGAPFKPRSVDVLIFNPPYVPTDNLPLQSQLEKFSDESLLNKSAQFERDSYLLSLSYAGGRDGMETTNRLLAEIPSVLSDKGIAYVLLCAQNRPDKIIDQVQSWPESWSVEKIGTSGKTAGWEKLCILRIWRKGAA